jgi:hypothetical protein
VRAVTDIPWPTSIDIVCGHDMLSALSLSPTGGAGHAIGRLGTFTASAWPVQVSDCIAIWVGGGRVWDIMYVVDGW